MESRTPKWKWRRVLLTGGAGFIGAHFAAHSIASGLVERLVVLDSLTYAADRTRLDAIARRDKLRFIAGDIADQRLVSALLRDEALDCIINFAAETHVDRSIRDPGPFISTNVVGVRNLLEAARTVWCAGSGREHRFHQISTDEVFGPVSPEVQLRNEASPYAPHSPYSATKAAGDHLVMAWRNTYGLQASISYSSNVYGPGQHPEKFVPRAIQSLIQGRLVPVYGDGLQRRSWIFVRDLCQALELMLAVDTVGRRLFLGAEQELSNLELLQHLVRLACGTEDAMARIEHIADRPGHDRRYGLTSREFRSLTGFREPTSLDAGLTETIDWYRGRSNVQS